MKKIYYILSIVSATIMLSACDDDKVIDNIGTGEPELFTLTFGSSAYMSDQDAAAQKAGTRIALDPSAGVDFSWVGTETIKMANLLLPETGVKDFEVTNKGAISGNLPIADLEKVDGSTADIKVCAYTGGGISSNGSENNSISITYPSTRTFTLITDDASKDYQNYGSVLPFVSEPVESSVKWSGDNETGSVKFVGTASVLNFRPRFSTIRLCLYLPDALKGASACDLSSINAKIMIDDGGLFDSSLELDMNNNSETSSQQGSNTMATNITYGSNDGSNNTISIEGKNLFVVPIFASRAKDIKSFTVTVTMEAPTILAAGGYQDFTAQYTITATRTVTDINATWNYGDRIDISIPAENWIVTKK